MNTGLVRIRFNTFISVVSLLPLSVLIFCVIWTILFNYEEVTKTHCHVFNFLPAVSQAVGGYSPQKYIWRTNIALHCAPRILISRMYYNYYKQLFHDKSSWLLFIFICHVLQIAEIMSLLGLTYISSSENFPTHQKLFVSFVICAFLSMFLLYCIVKRSGDYKLYHPRLQEKSAKLKLLLLCTNLFAFCISLYFYFRHNWDCEAGLYSLFALAEYVGVLSNIAYHYTSNYDFFYHYITAGSEGIPF